MCGGSPNGFVPSGTPSALGNGTTSTSAAVSSGNTIPWMGTFWPLMMVILWAVVIYAIVVLVRHFTSSSQQKSKESILLDILKERYASGEIDHDEFTKRKKELGL